MRKRFLLRFRTVFGQMACTPSPQVGAVESYHSQKNKHSKEYGECSSDAEADFVLALRWRRTPQPGIPLYRGGGCRFRDCKEPNAEQNGK